MMRKPRSMAGLNWVRRMHPTTSGKRIFHRIGPAPSPDWLRDDFVTRWPTTIRIDQNGPDATPAKCGGLRTRMNHIPACC